MRKITLSVLFVCLAASGAFAQYFGASSSGGGNTKEAKKACKAAKEANTMEAYMDFLTRFPDYECKDKQDKNVKELLQELTYQNVVNSSNPQDYLSYMETYKDDSRIPDLRKALEKARFNSIQRSNKIKDWQAFVRMYPKSEYLNTAMAKYAQLSLQDAKKLDSVLAYNFWMRRFSRLPGAEEVKAKIVELQSKQGKPSQVPYADLGVEDLLAKARKSVPDLARHECVMALARAVQASPDPYGAEAEKIRGQLEKLSKSEKTPIPALCKNLEPNVTGENKMLLARSVWVIERVQKQKKEIEKSVSGVRKTANLSQMVQNLAAAVSEDYYGAEIADEAEGEQPGNPENPQDLASTNAQEAARRAEGASTTLQDIPTQEVDPLLDSLDDHVDLLTEIIAWVERPSVSMVSMPAPQAPPAPMTQ